MSGLDPGFPEWTEIGQDGGLDPLGMQRPIEEIFQSLLPGVSTITLRYRYYSFFAWILEKYAVDFHDPDLRAFSFFHRKCETLLTLICALNEGDTGVAGIEWARNKMNWDSDFEGDDLEIEFATAAHPDTPEGERYLKNKRGALGGIYLSQMRELGLVHPEEDSEHSVPICSQLGVELADKFESTIRNAAPIFLQCVESGTVTVGMLKEMKCMRLSAIEPKGEERELLSDLFLGRIGPQSELAMNRQATTLMLLELAKGESGIPDAEAIKWTWFEVSRWASSHTSGGGASLSEVRLAWSLYHAFDLLRQAYESILLLALDILERAGTRGVPITVLVSELIGMLNLPTDQIWRESSRNLVGKKNPADVARKAEKAMRSAMESKGETESARQAQEALALVVAVTAKVGEYESIRAKWSGQSGRFQSLWSEVNFLSDLADSDSQYVVTKMICERILERHLWVATRKFSAQRAYTFCMEPDDGCLRFRSKFTSGPSSPRLRQAISFLGDVHLVHNNRITKFGRDALDLT